MTMAGRWSGYVDGRAEGGYVAGARGIENVAGEFEKREVSSKKFFGGSRKI